MNSRQDPPSTIRLGVTGSGFMGKTHAVAAQQLPDFELKAIAGGSRAASVADFCQIEVEASVESLVHRPDIDAIVISTPHYCHVDETIAAAEQGKHVLVEKPMATSVEDADRMIAACRQAGVVLSVGYHQRFRRAVAETGRLIQQGAIGQVRCIQTSALFDIQALRGDSGFGGTWQWWSDPRSRAHLLNSGPHTIDLCRWWMQTEVQSVTAHCATYCETDNPNENTTMALLQFANGAACTFWSSSVVASPGFAQEDFRFRIMGDEGLIDLDPYDQLRLNRANSWETLYRQPAVGFDDADAAFAPTRLQAYCDQLSAFAQSIRGTPGGEGSAEDGRAAVAAILAMLKSSAESGALQRV